MLREVHGIHNIMRLIDELRNGQLRLSTNHLKLFWFNYAQVKTGKSSLEQISYVYGNQV